jgi:hypothetical protein
MPRLAPDDSYDAAMRAADAFFSIPSSEDQADSRAARISDDAPLDPVERAPATPEKAGGRILRVLDEAPPQEYSALEAEHAPKRRGRKPGSRNKPKRQDDATAAPPDIERPSISTRPKTAPITVPSVAALPPRLSVAATPARAIEEEARAVRDQRRFPWISDRLKPGEDWKRRRLPRICW